jgi:precorrin-8X/cobalt-precorrin-8 methylmutase
MTFVEHPITAQSFAVIDQEIGSHGWPDALYPIVRRVIHTTADFEYQRLLRFSGDVVTQAQWALSQGYPIITDVGMVAQGIRGIAQRTWQNPIMVAIEQVSQALPGQTLSATALLHCAALYPHGIFVIGNAPTALLALCEQVRLGQVTPALIVGAPVGFINVLEAKQALSELSVPQILVSGRKGGSPVAAAIVNALMILTWQQTHALG